MSKSKQTVYIDTNVFIQFRDLKDIPWGELFPDLAEIEILVAPCVIEELDKLKISNNDRQRDRARQALKAIEKASESESRSITLRSKPLSISLSIAFNDIPDWTELKKLDPLKNDDRLVAEVLTHGPDAALISYDIGPLIRARVMGVEAHKPLDDWLLPEGLSKDQKSVIALQKQLKAIKSSEPQIKVELRPGGEESGTVRFSVPILPPLDDALVLKLSELHLAKNPIKSVAPFKNTFGAIGLAVSGISERAIESYRTKYADFEERTEAFFKKFHEAVEWASRTRGISYKVSNLGKVSTSGLRIDSNLIGNAGLLSEEADSSVIVGSRALTAPKPPKPPEPADPLDIYRFSRPSDYGGISEKRDPTLFYWYANPKGGKSGALQCEDFRPTRVFDDTIYFNNMEDLPFDGTLNFHVSATNLSAPVNLEVKIVMEEASASWKDSEVLSLLPDYIRKII